MISKPPSMEANANASAIASAFCLFFANTPLKKLNHRKSNQHVVSKTLVVDHPRASKGHQLRHEICQKIYTAGISGQRFDTFDFTEFQQL